MSTTSPGLIAALLQDLGMFGEAYASFHIQNQRITDAASQETNLARLEQSLEVMGQTMRRIHDAQTDAITHVLRHERDEFAAFERDMVIAMVREVDRLYGVAVHNFQPLIDDLRRSVSYRKK